MHTEANSQRAAYKRPCRRRNGKKNARRRGEERQGLACKRRQILRPQRRNDHAGEEIGRKMHAGEMKKGRGQRAHGGKFPAGRVETPEPAEKREEKCTPARRRTTGASVQKEANSQRASSKRTSQRRNRMKNARRRGEERQRPACKRRQTPRRRAVFQYM